MTPGEKGGGSPSLHLDSFFSVGQVLLFTRFFIGQVLYWPGSLLARSFIGQVLYWPGSSLARFFIQVSLHPRNISV